MKLCGSQIGGRHWARKVFSYATVCFATTVQWSSETAPETSSTMITGSQQKLDRKLAGPLAALFTDTTTAPAARWQAHGPDRRHQTPTVPITVSC